MENIITVTNLTKTFGNFTAVDNLSFEVPRGSIFGFLGQNGAGKSTTIRMLTGLIQPTSGSMQMFGKKINSNDINIRKNIGAVIERPDLYKYLSAYENVQLFAKLSGTKADKKTVEDVLYLVGLEHAMHKKMKQFSQGMKQRLGIATALVHQPDLIMLDEPVNGLDPQGIADMRHLILKLRNELGKTVVVSSHLLAEMEMIATDLLIIHNGKKVVSGKINDLLNPSNIQIELLTLQPANEVKAIVHQLPYVIEVKLATNSKTILLLQKSELAHLSKTLTENNIAIIGLRPQHTLEDYFIQQTSIA
jgi:ABC-type multidrug transport system ATPase subunit